jgi:hypothetical protein
LPPQGGEQHPAGAHALYEALNQAQQQRFAQM